MIHVQALTARDGTAIVTIAGVSHKLVAVDLDEARAKVVSVVKDQAVSLDEPVTLSASDPEGSWIVVVAPDGTVHEPLDQPPAPLPPTPPLMSPAPPRQVPTTPPVYEYPAPAVPIAQPGLGSDSFVDAMRDIERPATCGGRGLLARTGWRVRPGKREKAEREATRVVGQHWPGPRTVVIVNGKGGAGKTPATIALAAAFARLGGPGVVAWDANQTRGTLGWRTHQANHDATVLDLLPQAPHFLSPAAHAADMGYFMHTQPEDAYDVLRSQPIALAAQQRVTPQAVDIVGAILSRFYRLIFVDTGNDESDPVWLRVVEHANQIVVPTTTRADHAEAGALLLNALRHRDPRSRWLAENAVAVVTQADRTARKTDIANIASGYTHLVREVVTIPHDPALVDGIIHWDAMRPPTQRAWLAAAAAVARGL